MQGEDGGLAIAKTPSDNPSPRYYKSNNELVPRKIVIKNEKIMGIYRQKGMVSGFCDSKPINIPMKTQTPKFRCYCSSSVCRVTETS